MIIQERKSSEFALLRAEANRMKTLVSGLVHLLTLDEPLQPEEHLSN
jgi:hypothetical protein